MRPTEALTDTGGEWLTVHEACALIGVSPSTLRRWSDAGDVRAFMTPGGHRRFARSTILAMLPNARRERPSLVHLGETADRMMWVYRRHVAEAREGLSWLADLDDDTVEQLRDHGRGIAASLLSYVDANSPTSRAAALQGAVHAASEHGRIAADADVAVAEVVLAFLRFRMLFLDELVDVARRRGLDTQESTEVLATAVRAFDQLLVGLMDGHRAGTAEAVRA
jgi:excisionase family DNA binding protein